MAVSRAKNRKTKGCLIKVNLTSQPIARRMLDVNGATINQTSASAPDYSFYPKNMDSAIEAVKLKPTQLALLFALALPLAALPTLYIFLVDRKRRSGYRCERAGRRFDIVRD